MELLEQVHKRATRMIRGLKCLFYEGRLKELRSFDLEKKRCQKDLIEALQYLKRAYQKDGEGFLTHQEKQGQKFNNSQFNEL